jgi:hypothetical protein
MKTKTVEGNLVMERLCGATPFPAAPENALLFTEAAVAVQKFYGLRQKN